MPPRRTRPRPFRPPRAPARPPRRSADGPLRSRHSRRERTGYSATRTNLTVVVVRLSRYEAKNVSTMLDQIQPHRAARPRRRLPALLVLLIVPVATPAAPRHAGRRGLRLARHRRPDLALARRRRLPSLRRSAPPAPGSARSASAAARSTLPDACARYGAGSLVNTFVPGPRRRRRPDRALLPRAPEPRTALDDRRRLRGARRRAGGRARARSSSPARSPARAALAALRRRSGSSRPPSRVAVRAAPASRSSRVSHLLDAFRALGREPRGALRLVAWIALSTAGRLAAATAVGAALGIQQPLAAAVVIVPPSRSPA